MNAAYRFALSVFCLLLTWGEQAIPQSASYLTPYGLQGSIVNALASESLELGVPPPGPLQIFAGTEKDGVFTCDPLQKTAAWKSLNLQGRVVTALGVQHWGVGPRDGLTLLAALLPGASSRDTNIIYRREVGILPDTAWTVADSGIDRAGLHRINALDAFYYTGHQPPERIITGGERGMYYGGRTVWIDAKPGGDVKINDLDCFAHWPGARNDAWAAGQIGVSPGAVHSTDRGLTWGGVYLPAMIEGEAFGVAINPRSADSVIVGGMNMFWITGDGGKTWNSVSLGTSGVRLTAVAFDPVFEGNVYAGGADFQNSFCFFHSTDGGRNWKRIIAPVNTPLNGVSALLALNTGSPDFRPRIFLATLGTGVWLYDPSAVTDVERAEAASPGPEFTAYPNPFGPGSDSRSATMTISFRRGSPDDTAESRLWIRDIHGRLLFEGAGNRQGSFIWRPGEIPAGFYMCTIFTPHGVSIGGFLYLK